MYMNSSANAFFDGTKESRTREYARITDNLFIGSKLAVYDEHFLTSKGIKLIVNASNRDYLSQLPNDDIPTIKVLNIEDIDPGPALFKKFAEESEKKAMAVNKQMHEYISNGCNVLVHCEAGINRSSFIIAKYLIDYRNIPLKDVLEMIESANREQRKAPALTNYTFRYILQGIHKQ